MARDDLFFRIRLPEALKSEIQRLAVANHRSANAEIVARLNESIALGLKGMPLDAGGYKSVDEIDDSYSFANELAKVEGKNRQLMIDGLRHMLGVLETRQEQAALSAKKPRTTPKK